MRMRELADRTAEPGLAKILAGTRPPSSPPAGTNRGDQDSSGSGEPTGRGRLLVAVGLALGLVVGGALGFGFSRSSEAPTDIEIVAASSPTAAPTVAPVDAMAAFCAGARQVRMDDINILADRLLHQPVQTEAAYRDVLTYAPAELQADVAAQRPVVEGVIAKIHAGKLTSAAELRDHLAAEPQKDLEAWVMAQSRIVTSVTLLCP